MFKPDVTEAVPICETVLQALLAATATRGRTGADLRSAIGDFLAHAPALLQGNLAGEPLGNIFELARLAGVTLAQLDRVRNVALAQPAISVGAIVTRDNLVLFALAAQARVLADTTFVSRDDAEAVRNLFNAAFGPTEEVAADAMDSETYRALVETHAAVSLFLIETARPLPRMLHYRFAWPLPSLVTAYRLYADASRGDELRAENKIVHPAFCPVEGKALSK